MAEHSTIDWKKDSQSFDTVAGLYDQYRPEYPPELVESVIALSGLPGGGRILEVGSGTGKATRLFARRGYVIHCIEPGRNLAAVAARNLQAYPAVTFENTRFEDRQGQPAGYDLVMSAQAFHWVPREIGYRKASEALKPGGALALFWNMSTGFKGKIEADLDNIYHEIVPELGSQQSACEATIQERLDQINESACFGPVTIRRFPWSQSYRTGEYLGLINTYSDHLRLPERTRQCLFEGIAAAIDAQGGSVEREYIVVLYVAKKLS
jgi:SAM-dependent methyltransferase